MGSAAVEAFSTASAVGPSAAWAGVLPAKRNLRTRLRTDMVRSMAALLPTALLRGRAAPQAIGGAYALGDDGEGALPGSLLGIVPLVVRCLF